MNRRAMMMGMVALMVLGAGCSTQQPDMSSVSSLAAGAYHDDRGARPNMADYKATPELKDVHFAFDSDQLRPEGVKILDASAAWLKGNGKSIVIEGHCDVRGTNEYNLVLGERRARAAMSYLVSKGVDARKIAVVSFGEDRPQCQEDNEACWAKNRRAHFLAKVD